MYELRLKELRKAAGFNTQKSIADYLGIKERRYASWERQEVALTLEDAYKLALALKCTPNDLCGWDETHHQSEPNDLVLKPDEREIVSNYRQSTPQWKQNIQMTARAAAGESKEASERGVSASVAS